MLNRTVLTITCCFALLACAGLVPSSAQAAAAAPLNVRDLGAKGDGQTDDAPAFQKGLDALSKSGGVLFVPAGRYRIAQTLRVSGGSLNKPDSLNWMEIRGEGEASQLLGDEVDYILDAQGGYDEKGTPQYVNGLRIAGLQFTSFNTDDKKRCGGINASRLIRWSCQNAYFINLRTGIYAADKTPSGKNMSVWCIRLHNNLFFSCHDYAIRMGRVFDLTIDNNIVEQSWGGISIGRPGDGYDAAANTLRVTDNCIEGIVKEPALLGSCWIGARVVGNHFEANSAGDLIVTPQEKDGWTRGLTISANTFAPTKKQRQTGQYGPIRLTKTLDAVITGNFTVGPILMDPASQPLGRGVNIASNILNNPAAVTTMEGATPGAIAQPGKSDAIPADTERWEVTSSFARVGLDARHGFRYEPHGQPARSIAYGEAPPTKDEQHEPGDLVLNLEPKITDGRLLFGWTCIAPGRPGTWKPLYLSIK